MQSHGKSSNFNYAQVNKPIVPSQRTVAQHSILMVLRQAGNMVLLTATSSLSAT